MTTHIQQRYGGGQVPTNWSSANRSLVWNIHLQKLTEVYCKSPTAILLIKTTNKKPKNYYEKEYIHWSALCQPVVTSALSRWSIWTPAPDHHCLVYILHWWCQCHRLWSFHAAPSVPATRCPSCCVLPLGADPSQQTCTCNARCVDGSVICTATRSRSSSMHEPVINTTSLYHSNH